MIEDTSELTAEDFDLIWYLSSSKPCSLEEKPGDDDNWIERAGGSLPTMICNVAKGIMRSGKSKDAAIAISISRIKVWAAGGGNVKADTQAKAAKALTAWTALKAKAAAKNIVKATAPDGEKFIILSSVTEYSLDQVREAWDAKLREIRNMVRSVDGEEAVSEMAYGYVREVYTTHVIASFENTPNAFYKVDYTVDETGKIEFGALTPVKLEWVSEDNDWRAEARK